MDRGIWQPTIHGVARVRHYLATKGREREIPLFIAALFTIAKAWKQPRCPLPDEWIKKLWYIYTMEYYSAIKRNAFESVLIKWVKLEPSFRKRVRKRKINIIF